MVGLDDPVDGTKPKKNGKKEKKGFKVDRYEKYKRQFDKKARRKEDAKKAPTRVKEVRFDAKAREEWLTTRHKEKNARRVAAHVDRRVKQHRENSKLRKELREEARQQYNNYARVPILPDFSYKVPKYVDEFGRPKKIVDGVPVDDNDEAPEACPMMNESTFFEDKDAVHGEGVRVDVKPLTYDAPVRKARGGLDFSDLPADVAAELNRLHESQQKGQAQTKRKIHMLKEMAKINKIAKHSRKGHNKKKSGTGKRKNNKKK